MDDVIPEYHGIAIPPFGNLGIFDPSSQTNFGKYQSNVRTHIALNHTYQNVGYIQHFLAIKVHYLLAENIPQ